MGLGRQTTDLLSPAIDLGISSPWAEGNLSSIVLSEIIGADVADSLPMTRAEAITIPAVSKGRNLLISTICKFPLVTLDATGATSTPPFLYRTDTAVTPYERMAWTIDDLIFYGYSLWVVERGAEGQILTANWCPHADWKVTNGHVLINDAPAEPETYILFNSPFEGLLNIATVTLKGARDQEKAWTAKVRNPIPLTVIRSTGDTQLTQPEIDGLLGAWGKARRSVDGALGYLPPELELQTHGVVDPALFIEGRNAARTDIGSFLNIPVSMLDGTIGVDSLTYSTETGTRNRFYDESVPFWTDPIEARLSMDDVVPRGTRTRFDKTEAYAALPNPTDAPEQD